MQCGSACLKMICNYFGKEYGSLFFSEICYVTTEGVSLLSIAKAAKEIGLRTISGSATVNSIIKIESPCILHWNQNHFVVLYKVKKGKTFS